MRLRAILASLTLDFPRPRDARLVTSADFVHLKRHCLELLDHDDGRQWPRLTRSACRRALPRTDCGSPYDL